MIWSWNELALTPINELVAIAIGVLLRNGYLSHLGASMGNLSKCLSNERNDTAERPDCKVRTSSSYVAVVRYDTKEYSDTVADDAWKNNGERTLSVLSTHSFDAASLQYLQEDRSGRDAWLDRDYILTFLTAKVNQNTFLKKPVVLSPLIWNRENGLLNFTIGNVMEWVFPVTDDYDGIIIHRLYNNHWTIGIWIKTIKKCIYFDPTTKGLHSNRMVSTAEWFVCSLRNKC
ncbi:hypothetical protein FQA39_LY05215 [Lamprigera yunnana]|nr:hypothetical protein FQA39_LY05215 [Lamprigera yunnana]